MRQLKCSSCSAELPVRSGYRVNDQFYCGPCGEKAISQLEAMNAPVKAGHAVDPTVCSRCEADGGATEFNLIKNIPHCPACYEKAYNWPFPRWLQYGMAFLLTALLFALIQGIPYFRAGRALYGGEHLINARKSAQAVPLLQYSLKVAPDCEKCALLLGKAFLLTGDADAANKALLAHYGGRYKQGELFDEVERIMSRAVQAAKKADEAGKAYEAKDEEGALRLMSEAQKLYPEYPGFADQATVIEAGLAFNRKDYDSFATLARQSWDTYPSSAMTAAQYASALACKYAVTGDDAFRIQAEQVLEKARVLCTADQKANFAEFEERFQYRLKTRVIIDKDEYDRRFRQQAKNAGGQK